MLLSIERTHASRQGAWLSRAVGSTALTLAKWFGRGALRAIISIVEPSPWLTAEVENVANSFAQRAEALLDNQLADLTNTNLDTGVPENLDANYPIAVRAREKIERRRGKSV